MGTRLYPKTDRKDIIEILAGVPLGTSVSLKALESKRDSMRGDEWYDMMDAYTDESVLYDFELFGFGKLNSEQWGIAKELYGEDAYNGGTTKGSYDTYRMLNACSDQWKSRLAYINIDELDGVYWG